MADKTISFTFLGRDRSAGSTMKKLGGETDGLKKRTVAFGAAAGVVFAEVAKKALDFAGDSIKAYADAQKSQVKLEDAFKRFPKLADVSIGALRDLNTQLQAKTGFDDDAFASGQAILAQFNLTGKQIQGLTPLLADYAAKTGKDIPGAAKSLGKAFLGNTRALKDLGINYKLTGNSGKDMAAITDLMRQKVGGFAEKEGKTAEGRARVLSVQFEDVKEKIGQGLLPVMTKLANFLINTAIPAFSKLVDWVKQNASWIKPLAIAVGSLVAVVYTVVKVIRIWTAVQAALDVVLAANPIGLVVIAIGALVAAFVVAYKKSETFRAVVHGAMHAVARAVDFVRDHWRIFATAFAALIGGPILAGIVLVVTHFGKIKSAASDVWHGVSGFFGKIVEFITGMPGKIARAASGMWDGIKDAFRSAIDWVIDGWNSLRFTMPSINTHIPGVGKVGGFTVGVPAIPRLATGGIVPATPGGRLILAGEAGHAERVTPLDAGGMTKGERAIVDRLDKLLATPIVRLDGGSVAFARRRAG